MGEATPGPVDPKSEDSFSTSGPIWGGPSGLPEEGRRPLQIWNNVVSRSSNCTVTGVIPAAPATDERGDRWLALGARQRTQHVHER